jgi:hypothetical protein
VLGAPTLSPQLLFFANPQACGVQLRDLEAEEILALGTVPLGAPRAVGLVARRPELGEEPGHALPEIVDVRKAVEHLQLAGGLEQSLVLVLPVDVDQLIAQALEQAHRHR